MKKHEKLAVVAAAAMMASSLTAAEAIRIGGLFDLSGKAQHIGQPTLWVAQMVVDRLNEQGGLQGRRIELVVADAQSEPAQAVVALRRLLDRDKVAAVIGPTTTGAAMACMKTIEDAGVPMVACVGGDAPVVPARKWVFKTPQRTSTAVERLYAHLQGRKLATVGILAAGDKFGQEGEQDLQSLAARFGIRIVARESFDPLDADMTVQLGKLAAARPAAVVVWTIGPGGAVVARNARQAGIRIPLFQCHGQPDPIYLKLAGEAANGSCMPSTKLMVAGQLPESDRQRAGVQDFVREYQRRKLGEVSTHSGYAWDAVQLVFRAMEKVGTEPAALRDAIENTRDYVGVSGIYNMSATDHCGLGVDSLVMIEVKDGQWRLME
ncbi:MAG TPA: ABC transporter substrate-binding protein [Candidatus Paceibacterota bacterium]|nr:ABC transporter substrate-binding protein [Verrucomicrobiota bacterium]HOX03316.1 ABC transporter substrate-binding protein [Verrucomicrobiota bacterium]HRZ46236.1 ABC transporter substrate-binding protein [Candidatus Paceibacterota bacterium]